jgi:hypothetical protein
MLDRFPVEELLNTAPTVVLSAPVVGDQLLKVPHTPLVPPIQVFIDAKLDEGTAKRAERPKATIKAGFGEFKRKERFRKGTCSRADCMAL